MQSPASRREVNVIFFKVFLFLNQISELRDATRRKRFGSGGQ
jgi:hypothetical protein